VAGGVEGEDKDSPSLTYLAVILFDTVKISSIALVTYFVGY